MRTRHLTPAGRGGLIPRRHSVTNRDAGTDPPARSRRSGRRAGACSGTAGPARCPRRLRHEPELRARPRTHLRHGAAGLRPRPPDRRRRRDPGARRRDRRGRGRVLLRSGALAPRHQGAARRQGHGRPRPRRADRALHPARALRRRAETTPERGLAAAEHARPARAQPAGDRRATAGGGGRGVRRRQRARRETRSARPGRRSSSATRPSPRTRRSPTSTPRPCARAGIASRSGPSAACGARPWPRCGADGSTCGRDTTGRCTSSSAPAARCAPRSRGSALNRCGSPRRRTATSSRPRPRPRGSCRWRRSATSRSAGSPVGRAPPPPSRCRTSSGRSPRAACSTCPARGA